MPFHLSWYEEVPSKAPSVWEFYVMVVGTLRGVHNMFAGGYHKDKYLVIHSPIDIYKVALQNTTVTINCVHSLDRYGW